MYTFCLNYRTKGLHLFPSFWGKSCASQYSIFFFFFRLAHLLLNFLVKRCAPFGQNIKQKVYTLWSKKCTPFASIFYRKVYTFCPIRLSFTTWKIMSIMSTWAHLVVIAWDKVNGEGVLIILARDHSSLPHVVTASTFTTPVLQQIVL